MSPPAEPSTLSPQDYVFTPTQDWFSGNIPAWRSLFPLVTPSAPRVLEIGCWEGRSSVFLLTELCAHGGSLVTVDHFDLLRTSAGRARLERVRYNLTLTGKDFRVVVDFSVPALMMLLQEEMTAPEPGFDWIYIDGSHEADDTLLDGELAWRLARKGAVFIFDDYHWDKEPSYSAHHPKRGVDVFMALHQGKYERLSSQDQYQMVLRKTTEMRIGFFTKMLASAGNDDDALEEALGYGVNIAFTVNSAYAMPASVAMRSAAEKTPGRISFYIIDCGLTETEKQWIQSSLPKRDDITVNFLPLPDDSLSVDPQFGAVWAKIDMISMLPVERVLYLDSDILVRSDLRELWKTDLEGQPVAAVADVGYPLGNTNSDEGRPHKPYFNAGVILMDLAKVRRDFDNLKAASATMKDAAFKDQDALNAHFSSNWTTLKMKWNAQGLGTYSLRLTPERSSLPLDKMRDPAIVHFTGPVHPSMADVLNPFVQPYLAKPWGYAGAPGHPFVEEWWRMLDKTIWKGYIEDGRHKQACLEKKESAMQDAMKEFEKRVDDMTQFGQSKLNLDDRM